MSKTLALDGHECQVTASLGISLCPVGRKTAEALVTTADIAMYRAKKTRTATSSPRLHNSASGNSLLGEGSATMPRPAARGAAQPRLGRGMFPGYSVSRSMSFSARLPGTRLQVLLPPLRVLG